MPRFFDPEGAFWCKVDRSGGEDACWIWTRAVDPNGYGALKVWGRKINAHRYSYELHYGSIQKGLDVCHRCNNRICVNPKHLYAGTRQQNVSDAIQAGTHYTEPPPRKFGHENGISVLSNDEVLNIYHRCWDGEKLTHLAKEYGIHISTVFDIKNGRK